MRRARVDWLRYLVAILLGNGLYFAMSPCLPPAARHRSWVVDLGTIVDFWFCLVVYGLMNLGVLMSRRGSDRPSRRD